MKRTMVNEYGTELGFIRLIGKEISDPKDEYIITKLLLSLYDKTWEKEGDSLCLKVKNKDEKIVIELSIYDSSMVDTAVVIALDDMGSNYIRDLTFLQLYRDLEVYYDAKLNEGKCIMGIYQKYNTILKVKQGFLMFNNVALENIKNGKVNGEILN